MLKPKTTGLTNSFTTLLAGFEGTDDGSAVRPCQNKMLSTWLLIGVLMRYGKTCFAKEEDPTFKQYYRGQMILRIRPIICPL